jgi:hypothetical protein
MLSGGLGLLAVLVGCERADQTKAPSTPPPILVSATAPSVDAPTIYPTPSSSVSSEPPNRAGDVVTGDWDGDGTMETVRLIPPTFPNTGSEDDFGECIGDCSCVLSFETRPSFTLENCIGGVPVNEGNLDGHPGDEFGILPHWWTSCWHSYFVFGLRGQEWVHVVDPVSTHCSQWDDGVDAVERDPARPGYVLVRSTDMSDFRVRTKSVKAH